MNRVVHPIETESYRILRSAVDTSGLPPYSRDVAERIIHTTAEPGWLSDLVLDEAALAAGAAALAGGAQLIADVRMVAAGITRHPVQCFLPGDAGPGVTRAAAGFREAAARCRDGAVWAVGNAPTALFELMRLAAAGLVRPALVIGLPVGYVGAAESKASLRASGLPQLSNVSARGGAAIAAAAVNALLYGEVPL